MPSPWRGILLNNISPGFPPRTHAWGPTKCRAVGQNVWLWKTQNSQRPTTSVLSEMIAHSLDLLWESKRVWAQGKRARPAVGSAFATGEVSRDQKAVPPARRAGHPWTGIVLFRFRSVDLCVWEWGFGLAGGADTRLASKRHPGIVASPSLGAFITKCNHIASRLGQCYPEAALPQRKRPEQEELLTPSLLSVEVPTVTACMPYSAGTFTDPSNTPG